MGGFSIWHILIFAILVLLLFGGSRFSNMMGDVAKGLKSFKQGLSDDEDEKKRQQQLPPQTQAPQQPIDVTPRPAEPVAPPPSSSATPSSSTPDDQTR